ncbi:MAG: hypothetical protein WCP96_16700 [Methylococcaceae bacterium]
MAPLRMSLPEHSQTCSPQHRKKNVCIVVSDLEAAYDTGGRLIQKALDDATQEIGRAEVSISPVNLESNEIYEILRKRLFLSISDHNEIADIAGVYANRLGENEKFKQTRGLMELVSRLLKSV